MIISGGENVYTCEVENVLAAHPKVKDVAVIGRSDAKWSETVHALDVLRDDANATEGEIFEQCVNRIAGYKRRRYRSCPGRICRGPPRERSYTVSCATGVRSRRELAPSGQFAWLIGSIARRLKVSAMSRPGALVCHWRPASSPLAWRPVPRDRRAPPGRQP